MWKIKCLDPAEGKEARTLRQGGMRHKGGEGQVKNGENYCISTLIFHCQGGQRSMDS